MRRTQFLTRPAYALALALASFGAAGLVATPAQAEKKDDKKGGAAKAPQPTKAFIPAYTEVKGLLDAAAKRPEVIAAKAKVSETERAYRSTRGRAAQEAARGQYDAAVAALAGLLTAEKAKADELFTKTGNDADKFFAGQLGFTYGGLAVDKVMQRRGLVAMIDSGNVPATEVGKYNYYAAGFAFDVKDYAAAEASLKAAIAAGYNGNDVKGLLAEAQNSSGRPAEALATIKDMVSSTVAAGQVPAADVLERAVLISYQSKSPDAAEWAIRRIEFYPTQLGWVAAGQILRELADAIRLGTQYPALARVRISLFGDEIEPTYAPGWVSALWLIGLTVVLATLLLRRGERWLFSEANYAVIKAARDKGDKLAEAFNNRGVGYRLAEPDGRRMLPAVLRQMERMAEEALDGGWQGDEVLPAASASQM